MPWIIGGAILGGGIISSMGQHEANVNSADSITQQMQFQERMSNTAWQRGVKDMEAAGLNPMLAYSKGPASVPSGNSMTYQNELAPLGGAIQSAGQAQVISAGLAKTRADTSQVEAQTELTQAAVDQTRAQTEATQQSAEQQRRLNVLNYPEALASAATADAKTKNLVAEYGIATHELALAKTNVEREEIIQRINFLRETLTDRIKTIAAERKTTEAEVPKAQAYQKMYEGGLGKYLPYLDPAGSAAGTAIKALIMKRMLAP